MKYLIGARGSRLSIAQTNLVIKELEQVNPDHSYDIISISTKGDTDSRPLFAMDQKGIFEKEIDRAVSEGKVDFAVHSLKDVPSILSDDLTLACVPKRGPANDVLITKKGLSLKDLPQNATVGTSSLRRAVQIRIIRPDIVVKPIRGNIETRIDKVGSDYDGIVLASAGITRLGISVPHVVLSIDDFVPSPGQGALAIVARSSDSEIISMLKGIEDYDSRAEVESEREFSRMIDSGCRFPVGAFAKSSGKLLTLNTSAFSVDGSEVLQAENEGSTASPELLGSVAGQIFKVRGVDNLALNWRDAIRKWNQ